jgi:hypothetical protein
MTNAEAQRNGDAVEAGRVVPSSVRSAMFIASCAARPFELHRSGVYSRWLGGRGALENQITNHAAPMELGQRGA